MSEYKIFTSESVSEGHPDKMADQISDAVLDAMLKDDPESRVACETLIKDNLVVLAGEITSSSTPDLESITRKVITDIGYDFTSSSVCSGRYVVITYISDHFSSD